MSDYWFPSVDGSGRVAAGAGRVVLRQPDGTEQVWSDVHRPCFVLRGALSLVANGTGSRPAGVYQCAPDGTVAPFQTSAGPVWGANDLAVGDGWVASANAGQRAIMVWPSGAIIDDAGSPSIWGSSLVCIKHPWDERRHLALNPTARGEADRPYLRLAEGDVRMPRLVEDLVAWCVGTTPWFRWPSGTLGPVPLGRDEFWPVPVYIGGRPYLLTHDHYQHLMLREPGRTVGHLVHRGVTDYPAIARVGDRDSDEVHVAWSAEGVLGEWRGRVRDLPLVDLTDLRELDPARRFPPRTLVDVPDTIDVFGALCGRERWTRGPEFEAGGTGHVMQGDQGAGHGTFATVTKGRHDPEQREVWVEGAHGVGLAFDRSNEIDGGYRLVNPGTDDTAVLYPSQMRAGDERRTPVEVLRVRDGHRARYTFLGRCLQVGRDEAGHLHGVFSYEFDSEGGWRELFFGHERAGRWEWRAIRKRTGEVTDVWTGLVERAPVAIAPVPAAYQRPPVALPPGPPDPPVTLTVGRADYPREITPAGFDVMFEDGAGRLRAEWSVRDGQRSVFALTLDGQRATRTVAHPTVIGVAPPGTPPAAGGPAYGPWVLERPSEYTRLREAVEAKWSLSDQATRDEKLAHAIKRRFEAHELAKILDEIAREGEESPPDVEPPPVDPPPPPSGDVWWTRQDIIDWRGGIAFDEELFSPFYLSWDAERRRRFRARCKALGATHVIVMLSGEYRGRFPWFSLWGRAQTSRVLDLLGELLADRLMPVLWAANGESFTAGARRIDATDRAAGTPLNVFLVGAGDMFARRVGQPLEAMWDESLPPLAPVLGAAMPAPEMNDIWTPEEQHHRTVLLRRLLPSTYLLVHFTRARSHGDHNRGTGPVGQPPPEWNPVPDDNNPGLLRVRLPDYWRATPVEGLYYNAPYHHLEDLAAFTDDLGDVSVRVNGRVPVPGKTAPYPGMGRDVIYGEGPAEWVLQGHWTWQDGQRLREAALSVPGITGWGD
ncbi:MAG: hypothetical protein KJ066_19580 [Acidobacteria bacterium]|nr:hypothetical protein [Acidobacteriota bacterium]